MWSWCFNWTYSIQVWLLWLFQMQHSCQWYFKGQWSNWNWNYYPQVCWHQGTIYLLTTSGLLLFIIQGLQCQSSSLSSELWRKKHYLWIWVEIHLTNQNHIDIPIDVFESTVPIAQNSLCTEDEKKKYCFLLVEASIFLYVITISMMPFLFELLQYFFFDNKFISDEHLAHHPPPLDEVWLIEPESCAY